jgi:cation diffusion facilitator family transporter
VAKDGDHDGHASAWKVVMAALVGNAGVAVVKFTAWFFTGSAAMFAESLHSLADALNQVFLLLGLRLGERPADEKHPFGYGREPYFFAFIVAVSIFLLGSVFSIYEGLHKLSSTEMITRPWMTYVALGIATLFETYALRIAWREFKHWRRDNPGPLLKSLRETKSPTIVIVLFEDTAALIGILMAAVGITLALVTGSPVYDAMASLGIGVVLFFTALFIGWKTRGLLIGEAATPADRQRIRDAVESIPEVVSVIELLTLHLGPRDILVNLTVNFRDHLDTNRLESAIDEIERGILAVVPAARRIFIEAESVRAAVASAEAEDDPSQAEAGDADSIDAESREA